MEHLAHPKPTNSRLYICSFSSDNSSHEIVVWLTFLMVRLIGETELRPARFFFLSQTEFCLPRREGSVVKK